MMSEETKIENGEDFAAMLEESFKTLNTGEKVTGTVVAVSSTDVQVDLGVKHTAYIPLSELSDDPNYDAAANIHPGDEIEAVVVRVNDGEGTVTLSKKRVDQLKGWETVEKAYEEHSVVEGIIVEENRGGVVATAYGVRVFIPASQTGIPKDQPMSQLVKTKQSFYITEINRQRKRVVGSIRQIQQEARKAAAEQIWSTIEVGNEYEGTVKSLTSYGAFVDIGGVDGMVHISELSWGRIKHPSEVVNVGDKVKVFVIGLDKDNKKISLGYKREEDNPWNVFKSKYGVGDVAEVKILKFMPFGAFAEIVPGVDGLIHISQIADHRIEKPGDVLAEGDKVDVILMNPPYGGSEKADVKNHFPTDLASSETADLFMSVIMYRLKKNGRAAVILPDGFLFGTDNAKVNIKKKLLREFNLHTIVRLPGSVFSPYTSITTNILFFDNTHPTEETWFYRLDMPEGYKHFSKTKPMKPEHFQPVLDWWNDRQEITEDGFDKSKTFTVQQLTEELGYNLDQCGYPHEEEEILAPMDLIQRYEEQRASLNAEIDRVLEQITNLLGGNAE